MAGTQRARSARPPSELTMGAEPGGSIDQRCADLLADEFARIPDEAARQGKPWHSSDVTRREHQLPDGTRLSFLQWWGAEPEIVLVHGGGLHAHSWNRVALALGTPLIAVDLPGHGESSWREDCNYSPQALADALEFTIRAVASRPVVLVGQSLGAMTSLIVAARAPDAVCALTMVDITPGRHADTEGNRQVMRFLDGPRRFATYEDVVAHALATGMGRDAAALERGVVLNTRRDETGGIVFKHHFASLKHPRPNLDMTPLWNTLELVECPVQLVRGARGIVDDQQLAEFSVRRPDATVHTLDAGHNVQRDAPERLAALIREQATGFPT